MQDLFPNLLEELSGCGLAGGLHLWEYNDSSAGDELFQRQGEWHITSADSDSLQLWLAGKSAQEPHRSSV